MPAFPVTPHQLDSYQRRARARVFWGHRASGVVDSLVRKGVRRTDASQMVGSAVKEYSGRLALNGLLCAAGAGVAGLLAVLLHSPQVLRGEELGAIHLGSLGPTVLPLALVAAVFALLAGARLLRALLRLV